MKIFMFTILIGFTSSLQASLCIAHRGFSGEYLENSLEAIREAILIGADGIEFDIRFTRDGIPILMHDPTLEKTGVDRNNEKPCPVTTEISKLNFHEMRELCLLENGENIPTLRELLDMIVGYEGRIFFDLKESPRDRFFSLLEEKNIVDDQRVRFLSFKKKFLRKVKKKRPGSQTLLLSRLIPRGIFF